MRERSVGRIVVRRALSPLPPRYTKWVARSVRVLAPLYLRFALRIRRYSVEGGEELARLAGELQQGTCRFLVAFRHPNVMDPECLYYLFSNRLRSIARGHGIRLDEVPHVRFLYGRGVPLWAGSHVGWLLQRVGATPVMQGHSDSAGLRRVRKLFAEGRFPIALAPEGQVSYHNHRVDRVESGAARLSVWCHEDLAASGKPAEVAILPIAPIYRYSGDPWRVISRILGRTCRLSGLELPEPRAVDSVESATGAMLALAASLLRTLERHYSLAHGYGPEVRDGAVDSAAGLTEGYRALARFVLALVERGYGSTDESSGRDGASSLVPRIYPVRRRGWERIFRSDLPRHGTLTPLERSLADRSAVEAYLLSRHLELVDLLAYFDLSYAAESPTPNRQIEVALNLYDVASRSFGRTIASRLKVSVEVTMRIGAPIRIARVLESTGEPKGTERTGRRDAVSAITAELASSLAELSRAEA